jgi:hypothetical protein
LTTISHEQAGHQPCAEADAGAAAADVIRDVLHGQGTSSSTGTGSSTLSSDRSVAASTQCAKEPGDVFTCMLRLYDSCKAGVGPHTLCDYFDD